MGLFDRFTSQLLRWSGLQFDIAIDVDGRPFDRITPGLVLGCKPRVEQVAELRALGVRRVVSCLESSKREQVAFLNDGFETLFLPLRDGMTEDIASAFDPFMAFMDDGSADRSTLVHCEVGVSRSATLATAFVMRQEKLRFFEAYRHVRDRRAQVLPNIGFASALQHLEFALFPESVQGLSSLAQYLKDVCNVPADVDVIQAVLQEHAFDAVSSIRVLFGGDIPRVVQGARR